MSEFDHKAAEWDNNPMHLERSRAVAENIEKQISLHRNMSVLEFGAGTGTTSMFLAGRVRDIVMMDSSTGMVNKMNEKIKAEGIRNLKALHLDLENDFYSGKFDLIFCQMVLHHVEDVDQLLRKFSNMLNPCGYIAIADLYPEDGEFHGHGFTGHNGFDPDELGKMLSENKFTNIYHNRCFTIVKEIEGKGKRSFDMFLLSARLE
jgi:ubiquinone/menaquinone biosynthesis C-methylase UbiE